VSWWQAPGRKWPKPTNAISPETGLPCWPSWC